MTAAIPPSTSSPKSPSAFTTSPSPPPVSFPPIDSLQPVAASPRISRTSSAAPPAQGSPGTSSSLSSSVRSCSPSFNKSSSPSPQPRHTASSFSSQACRLSIASASFTLTHRDSFHLQYPSSLPYTSVRDFAYPTIHPLHYGPPKTQTPVPESQRSSRYFDSGPSWYTGNTPGRRLSDPPYPTFGSYETAGGWGIDCYEGGSGSGKSAARGRATQPPPLQFEDGPPWNEDPDLHSPVVVNQSSRHRKHKSSGAHIQSSSGYSRRPSKNAVDYHESNEAAWTRSAAGNTGYFTSGGNNVGEPGGEYYSQKYYDGDYGGFPPSNGSFGQSNDEYYSDIEEEEDEVYSDDGGEGGGHRLSRRYHFSIASEAEEMHGKAVALFDFQKENENELGLVEGQIIWVSYRHGMGWLVAEDPKTRESGLVPEEYVRLLKDIQQPLFENDSDDFVTEDDTEEHTSSHNGEMKPVISTFSTSSQDIHPYPLPLSHGEAPPRTVSRGGGSGSQSQTPIAETWEERIQALEAERERALKEEAEEEQARIGFGIRKSLIEENSGSRIENEDVIKSKLQDVNQAEYRTESETKQCLGLGLFSEHSTRITTPSEPNGPRCAEQEQVIDCDNASRNGKASPSLPIDANQTTTAASDLNSKLR